MKGVFAFKVKGAGGKEGVWVVDVKNGSGAVKFAANGEKAWSCPEIQDSSGVSLVFFFQFYASPLLARLQMPPGPAS